MNYKQVELLKQYAKANDAAGWNAYRKTSEGKKVDFKFADLSYLNLRNFDLAEADLSFTHLRFSNMAGVDIKEAKLGNLNWFLGFLSLMLIFIIPLLFHWVIVPIPYIQTFDIPMQAQILSVSIGIIYSLFYHFYIGVEWKLCLIIVFLHLYIAYIDNLLGFRISLLLSGIFQSYFAYYVFYRIQKSKMKSISQALNPSLAIGYVAPSIDKNELEKQVEKLEAETYRITDADKQAEIRLRIAALESKINKQENFKSLIENSFRDLQKPNNYLDKLLIINWVLLVAFMLLAVGVLVAVGFVEYQVFNKFWVENKPLNEIPYLAYSPIVLGVVVFSFAITQFNRRLKEINIIYDRKRFIAEVESTLRAFGNFYAGDDDKIGDYFTQTINKLQDYYFVGQKGEKKAEDKEEGVDAKSVVDMVMKIVDKK